MRAVYDHLLAIQITLHGHSADPDGMKAAFSIFRLGMDFDQLGIEILIDIAAKGNIHDLMSPTDSQVRFVFCRAATDQRLFCFIPRDIDIVGTDVFLKKFGRIHVSAAC